jgi:hypothetical protein
METVKVIAGRVVGGRVEVPEEIAEGTTVAVLAPSADRRELTPAEEQEISTALDEIREGQFEDGFSLLEEISRRTAR